MPRVDRDAILFGRRRKSSTGCPQHPLPARPRSGRRAATGNATARGSSVRSARSSAGRRLRFLCCAGMIRALPAYGRNVVSWPSSQRTRYLVLDFDSRTSRMVPSRAGVPTFSDSTTMRSPGVPIMGDTSRPHLAAGVASAIGADVMSEPDRRHRQRGMRPLRCRRRPTPLIESDEVDAPSAVRRQRRRRRGAVHRRGGRAWPDRAGGPWPRRGAPPGSRSATIGGCGPRPRRPSPAGRDREPRCRARRGRHAPAGRGRSSPGDAARQRPWPRRRRRHGGGMCGDQAVTARPGAPCDDVDETDFTRAFVGHARRLRDDALGARPLPAQAGAAAPRPLRRWRPSTAPGGTRRGRVSR